MLRQVVTTLLALSLAVTAQADSLEPDALLDDLALARKALETMHPGYERYTGHKTLDAMWEQLEGEAAAGAERGTVYLGLSRILAAIRCDHTKAELPPDMEAARNEVPVYLPFRFRLFDGRMYVATSAAPALTRGDEVVSIDGIAIREWLTMIEPLVPVDGDSDHTKPNTIEYGTEFMGGALDHFAPFLVDITETARIEFRRANGELRTAEIERISYDDYQAMTGEARYSRNFDTSVRFETLGDDGAYLAVDTFVNYRRPVDPVAFLKPYFVALQQQGRTKLIVDMRKNGGGSNDAQDALLGYLVSKPVMQVDGILTRFTAIPADIRPHLDTWDPSALDLDPDWFEPAGDGFYRFTAGPAPELVEPLPHAFEGKVVILTGPVNASGVTHMLATLKSHGGIRFVGETTGGAPSGATANVIYFLRLPNSGILVRVPAQRTLIANRDALPQRDGIAPDIEVPQTAEDYFAGRDRTLEVAREALGL